MFPDQEAARAMGIALGGPTLQGHVAAGEVKIVHVPDKFNAADFLTKWVSAKKLKESVAYTSNEVAKPKEPITTYMAARRMEALMEAGER